MITLSRSRNPQLRRRLERLLHILDTQHEDASESKEEFAWRIAYDVECIIDELECPIPDRGPVPIGEVLAELKARRGRINARQLERDEQEWG